VLEIFGYSALFCIAVTSHNNAEAFKLDPNQTYEAFDNLAMGNVEVRTTHLISWSVQSMNLSVVCWLIYCTRVSQLWN
jgi:hypothetical protein